MSPAGCLRLFALQSLQQFGMDAAKAAIAHAENVIAATGRLADLRHQCLDVVNHPCAPGHGCQRLAGIPAQAATVAKSEVGVFQAPRQLRLHDAKLHGVGTRLEHRQNAFTRFERAVQAVHRGADGSGMMGKVVVNGDVAAGGFDGTTQFHAALDVLEAAQRLCRHLR